MGGRQSVLCESRVQAVSCVLVSTYGELFGDCE